MERQDLPCTYLVHMSWKALLLVDWVAMACRADSIVADAELIRECLNADIDQHPARWSLLGQSFGGFCAVQYLSVAPQGQPTMFTTILLEA